MFIRCLKVNFMNISIKNLWIHILAILIFKYLKIQFYRNIIMEYL